MRHATRRGNSVFSVTEQVLQAEFLPYATEQKLRTTVSVRENGAQPRPRSRPPPPTPLPTQPVFIKRQSIGVAGVEQ